MSLKRYLKIFIFFAICSCIIEIKSTTVSAAEIVDTGTCGENITWVMTDDGTLTISGEGNTEDYSYSEWYFASWTSYIDTMTKVVIEDGVTSIGDYLFYCCENVTEIVIPESVTSIGDSAFSQCVKLSNITIPESVIALGNSVFNNCDGLTSISLPSSITLISKSAFYSCGGLINISIPDSVVSIEDSAFEYCTSLKSITIPSSVTNIGDNVFSGCSQLNNIFVEEGNLNYCNDENGVLINFKQNKLVRIPCSFVGEYTIENGITIICGGAFSGCSNLTGVIIPTSVTEIGSAAFKSCSNLVEITLPDSLEKIGVNAFMYSGLESVTIPGNVADFTEAFSYCTKLEEVVICDGVKYISNWAFNHCEYLISVVIPDSVTNIGRYAFNDCVSLTDVSLPENLICIEYFAFANANLSELTIPESVTTIGDGAFRENNITDLIIPDSITYLGEEAFHNCSNLKNVVIGNGITAIKNHVFSYCTNLKEIIIPNSITSIAPYAFRYSGLISVTIPASVLSIADQAFYGCTNMRTIYFKGDAPGIKSDTFTGVTATAYYPLNNTTWINEKKQNYGGNLSWTSYVYEEEFAIVNQPANQTANIGDVVIFTVEATGTDLTYQWKYSTNGQSWYNSGMTGNTTNELTVPVLQKRNGQLYRCIITDSQGNELITDSATLTVEENVVMEIISQPKNINAVIGDDVIFSVEATGDNLTYQWQYSNNGGTYWYNSGLTGNNTNALTVNVTAKRNGQLYRCIITDVNGNKLTTDTVKLSVVENTLAIVAQPESKAISLGENVEFVISAEGDNLTYQWQYSNNGGTYWYNSGLTGSTTNALIVEALIKRDGQMYRCLVTDANGNQITSDSVTLTIIKDELKITEQPEAQSANVGEIVEFVVKAEGNNLTYQWQYSNNNGTYWYNSGLTGSTTDTLTVEVLEKRDGQMYRCVITDENDNQLTSETAILTIDKNELIIISQPETQYANIGEYATFVVDANGTNLTYQWQYSNNGGTYWYDSSMTGNDTNTLIVEVLTKRNGQMYRCVITDENGNEVITDTVMLHINESL